MHALRIGLFLGFKQIRRANLWATILVIIIILATYMNLVALSGVLLGIVEGALNGVRTESIGDVSIIPLDGETRILETDRVLEVLSTYSSVEAFSARYEGFATIQAKQENVQRVEQDPNVIAVTITGIDPIAEAETTNLDKSVIEGEYLNPDETGYILLGKLNIDRYADEFGSVFDSLDGVYPGDTVQVTVGNSVREYIVKGIIDSKVDFVSVSVFIPANEFRRVFERLDHNANQIAVRLKPSQDENVVRDRLRASDLAQLAKINSFTEDVPKFIADVRDTFQMLSLIVGIIGVMVASVTIFIVIFTSALANRKQIGILKAIGIRRRAIEYAYMTQAVFYVIVGSVIGIVITKFFLVPYFINNPIDFPFADASLYVTDMGLLSGFFILILVAILAGFIPVWLIVRQNTLDIVLGRK